MEHSFDVDVAVKYGIEKAVILKNISFWVLKNYANKKHMHEGMFWTYNSQKAFTELFPYLSRQQIGRHLRQMEGLGLIKSGNFNKAGYDRTKWYTVPSLFIVQNETTDCLDLTNQTFKSEQPIPDSKPDDKPDIKRLMSDKSDAITVLTYLNEVCSSKYKRTTKSHIENINARLAEGYTVEDCKSVIDTKYSEWINDSKMSKYLRPQTLFSASKFQGYLTQAKTIHVDKSVNAIGTDFSKPEGWA